MRDWMGGRGGGGMRAAEGGESDDDDDDDEEICCWFVGDVSRCFWPCLPGLVALVGTWIDIPGCCEVIKGPLSEPFCVIEFRPACWLSFRLSQFIMFLSAGSVAIGVVSPSLSSFSSSSSSSPMILTSGPFKESAESTCSGG